MSAFRVLLTLALTATTSLAEAATIDRMHTATFGHYQQSHAPDGQFMIFSIADYYLLSDGTSWDAGAGWHPSTYSTLANVSVSDATITYRFDAPSTGVLFQNTDYDSGNHSAQGILGLPAALEIVASLGDTTGTMRGYTQILSNDETWYGEPRFNYYSAPVGSFVYFEQTFSLLNDVFTADLFGRSFAYNEAGYVDFTRQLSVPEPSTSVLMLLGLLGLTRMRGLTRRRDRALQSLSLRL